MLLVALLLVVGALFGVYLSWTAGRIDRLHARVEAAAAALDAALLRRAAAGLAVAGRGAISQPAAAQTLAAAARAGQAADGLGAAREAVENALSRALLAYLAACGECAVDAELDAAVRRVAFARGFYNGAVADTLALRGRLVPRLAHLAGHAAAPAFFEIDDSPLRDVAGPRIVGESLLGDPARMTG